MYIYTCTCQKIPNSVYLQDALTVSLTQVKKAADGGSPRCDAPSSPSWTKLKIYKLNQASQKSRRTCTKLN